MKGKWHNTGMESATCWGGFISFYCPINILTAIKLRMILYVGHVARVGKKARDFPSYFYMGSSKIRICFVAMSMGLRVCQDYISSVTCFTEIIVCTKYVLKNMQTELQKSITSPVTAQRWSAVLSALNKLNNRLHGVEVMLSLCSHHFSEDITRFSKNSEALLATYKTHSKHSSGI